MQNKFYISLLVILVLVAGVGLYFLPAKQSHPETPEGTPETPQHMSMVGKWECLPVKNPDQPHTLECALGIAGENGKHYGIDTMLMSTYPVDFATGTKIRVEGVIVPAVQLSTDHWQKYDMEGIIQVTSIQKI